MPRQTLDTNNENDYRSVIMTTHDAPRRSRPDPAHPDGAPAARGRRVRRTTSETLFADAEELIIEHRGRDYRLRVTQNGKLILTA